MMWKPKVFERFPTLLLVLLSLADVVGEGCLMAGGLDLEKFLDIIENLRLTDCADLWVFAVARLLISLGMSPLCSFLSRRSSMAPKPPPSSGSTSSSRPERTKTKRGGPKEAKAKDSSEGIQGWAELLCMAIGGIAGTATLTKAAFLLIFDTQAQSDDDGGASAALHWGMVAVCGVASALQYILQRAVVRGAWSARAQDRGGLEEALLGLEAGGDGCHRGFEGAAAEACREAGREAVSGGGGRADAATSKHREDGGDQGEEWANLKAKRHVVSRLIGMAGPDWPWMAFGLFFLGVAAVAQAIVPKLTGDVINDIVLDGSSSAYGSALMKLSVASLVTAAASGLRGACFLVAMAKMNIRVREAVYAALLKQEIAFFDSSPTGDLTSRLSSDTTKMSESISLNMNVFFRSLVQAIGVLALMFTLQWRLTIVTFMAVPLIIAASKVYGDYYKKLTTLVQDAQASSNTCAEEAIGSIRTVRSFANEDGELCDYSSELHDMLQVNMRQAWAYLGYGSFVTLAPLITTVTVLYFGGHLVLEGFLKPGDLVSFVFYQQSLSQAISSMGDVFTGLMQAAGAADKVFSIMDRVPKISIGACKEGGGERDVGDDEEDGGEEGGRGRGRGRWGDGEGGEGGEVEGGKAVKRMRGHVRFDNVSFAYGSREVDAKVLDGVSFEALPGEVLALVGKSGSGKSSCVSLLEHFYEPTTGSVTIDGLPLGEYDHKALHRQVSLVGQEPVLYSRSVRDNITYGLDAGELTDQEVQQAASLACAHDFVMEMKEGYDTQVGERGSHLSGGQKQRIAIARALVRDPAVLLLDEATSALDSESEGLVQAAIDHSMRGRTVIVIAHRLSTIRNADKIVVLNKGRVVEVGSHNELLRRGGAYASLVSKQLGVEEREVTATAISSSPPSRDAWTPGGGRVAQGGGLAGWFGIGSSGGRGASSRRSPSPVTPQRQARRLAGAQGAL